MIGGQVGIIGHIEIGDDAAIGAQSGVSKNIRAASWLGVSRGSTCRSEAADCLDPPARKILHARERDREKIRTLASTCTGKQRRATLREKSILRRTHGPFLLPWKSEVATISSNRFAYLLASRSTIASAVCPCGNRRLARRPGSEVASIFLPLPSKTTTTRTPVQS